MKKELLSLMLMSSMIAPQGLVWADNPTTPTTPPTVSNDTNKDKQDVAKDVADIKKDTQDIKADEEKLKDVNAKIKSYEDQVKDLQAQRVAALKAGNKTLAEQLKDKIQGTRKEMREAVEVRNHLRRDIHKDMADRRRDRRDVRRDKRDIHRDIVKSK